MNLGCGAKPFDGWLNIDEIRLPNGISYDLRKGLPMLATETVDLIYHEHFMEHLDPRSGRYLIQECFRVLKKGGTMRIAMPDLDLCIRNYQEGWADQDNMLIEERKALYGDQLLGTPGEGLDLAIRGWGHKFLYGERDLVRMLELNGFALSRRVSHMVSEIPELSGLETRIPEQSALIVEAQK